MGQVAAGSFKVNDSGREAISSSNNMINSLTLLTGMSHEVRTHMNAIVAFSYLMNRNDCEKSEREEYSNMILSSCEQLIGLFDNFLDSAIIETGYTKSARKKCKLNTILDDLLFEFREIIRKECDGNVILVSEKNITEPTEVLIDTNWLFRIICNLFQNSLRNTKSGYIKIGYDFSGETVTFYVIDSGQGYFKSKEFLYTEDLNESLAKYNDTSSAVNITLARKLVKLMGGAIRLECIGLTGTGIYISIPVKVADTTDISISKYVNSMMTTI
jgi:K+-sensing histidine kinase KdpD